MMNADSNHCPVMRLGVLGCANIAKQFVRDVAPSSALKVTAVASRDTSKAEDFGRQFDVARRYGSYEHLLNDPGIDAVYIPLPNSMHAQWAIAALDSGKHVLCEKPLATSLDDVRAMFRAARRNNRVLLEAYPYQFQPQTLALTRMLHEGVIGDIRSVQACFGYPLLNKDNIRMRPELGGGALWDAGSYTVSLIRLVMGRPPQKVYADASWSQTDVDVSAMATLYFADGCRAQLSCMMNAANHRRAVIAGADGVIETEFLNHTSAIPEGDSYGYLPSQMRIRRGGANNIPFEAIDSEVGSGFRFAAESFASMVQSNDETVWAPFEAASLDIVATLEALAESARTGRAVEVVSSANDE